MNNFSLRNINLLLSCLFIISAFFLWDLKDLPFDSRIIPLFIIFVFFFINFQRINFRNYLFILFISLLLLIHYIFFSIFYEIKIEYKIIYFLILINAYFFFIKNNIEYLPKVLLVSSKLFIILFSIYIIVNINTFSIVENTVSGACGMFTNLASLKVNIFIENSHFGMVAPAAMFCILFSIKKKEIFKLENIFFYLLIIFLSFLVFSMTLLLGIVCGFICLLFSITKKNLKIYIVPAALVCLSILTISFKDSCSSRLSRLDFFNSVSANLLQDRVNTKIIDLVINFKEKYNQNSDEIKALISKCYRMKNAMHSFQSIEEEYSVLSKKLNINREKIRNFKKFDDETYKIQLETATLIKKKNILLDDYLTFVEFTFPGALDECKYEDNNLRDIELLELEIIKIKKEKDKYQNIVQEISFKDSLYLNPNITTQVYQIALLNTFNSITNEFFGWGYGNYKNAHFKYVLDNIIELDIKSKYRDENKPINSRENLQDNDVFYLNYNDGRNNFSKLVVEYGIFCIPIFVYLILFGISRKQNITNKGFLLPLLITQLGSGAGYTNGGFALSLIIVSVLLINEKKIK